MKNSGTMTMKHVDDNMSKDKKEKSKIIRHTRPLNGTKKVNTLKGGPKTFISASKPSRQVLLLFV